MVPFTDMLTYKQGIYHRTEDSFKFNGHLVVKIIGWESSMEGRGQYWIIENTWGEDWGEDGYARVAMTDSSLQLGFYGLGLAVYPMTLAEYYAMQQDQINAANMMNTAGDEEEEESY